MVAKVFLTETGYRANCGRSNYSLQLMDGSTPVIHGEATFGVVPAFDMNAPANTLNIGAELVADISDRMRNLVQECDKSLLDAYLAKLDPNTPKSYATMFFLEQLPSVRSAIRSLSYRERERETESKLKKEITEAKAKGDETKAALALASVAIAELGGMDDDEIDRTDTAVSDLTAEALAEAFKRLTPNRTIEEYLNVAMWCTAGVARNVVERIVAGLTELHRSDRQSIPFWPAFNDVIAKNNLRNSLDRLYIFFASADSTALAKSMPLGYPMISAYRGYNLAISPWFTPATKQKLVLEILVGYFFN